MNIFVFCTICTDNDDFFFGGGPLPDDKPSKSVKLGSSPQQGLTGKPSRVAGRIQVCVILGGEGGTKLKPGGEGRVLK